MEDEFECPLERRDLRLSPEAVSHLRSEIHSAVADGIRDGLLGGFEMLKKQAAASTGRFVLDGLWSVGRRAFWVSIFLAAVYSVGGWSLVVAAWKAFVGSKP